MIDTYGPYRAAYIIAAVVYAAYSFSVWWRVKRARERLRHARRDLVDR